jgi:MerR family transcriptional regulator, copper efflux regulator
MKGLTIGELARLGGVNRETVRYYERHALLPRPPRTVSGYRVFSEDALRRLRFVRRAKALGFSLREVKELLGLRVGSPHLCARVRARARAKIDDIDRRIEELRRMRAALERLVDACEAQRTTSSCPILDRLGSDDSGTSS